MSEEKRDYVKEVRDICNEINCLSAEIKEIDAQRDELWEMYCDAKKNKRDAERRYTEILRKMHGEDVQMCLTCPHRPT